MSIQRYDHPYYDKLEECDDGDYVLYSDHAAEVERLQEQVAGLRKALEQIADHSKQLPWAACAKIARAALEESK